MTKPEENTITIPEPSVINFVMVGCPRCGTTWVNEALKGHPNIYLPKQKQSYFFDSNYDKGMDWYMSRFADVGPNHTAIGEIATGYSLPHAVPLLAKHLPHIKVIIGCRNPVERAYSFYQSRSATRGYNSFKEATKHQPEILLQGQYADHIEQLLKYYSRDNILILFYDDLKSDDSGYLKTILRFLSVDDTYESNQIGQVVQVTIFPRLRRKLLQFKMGWFIDLVSRSSLGDYLRRHLKKSKTPRYKPIDPSLRQWLIDYYLPHNARLAELTGRNLNHWNE